VEVAVLGPVLVRGAAGPFRRSAARDLVVYLAFHRRGVRHAEWSMALWPERPVSLSTAHSTSSDARRALGCDGEGRLHLPRGVELRLGDAVTTDVEHFGSLATEDDPDQILRAMRLIRGPLFSGLHRADWAIFDGTHANIEALVVRTALRGADAFVRLALLMATAAQGNRVRLHSAMAQLRTLAGDLACPPARTAPLTPSDSLHPATTALYRDLLLGSPAAGGHPARL
jgi:hypothetical protein